MRNKPIEGAPALSAEWFAARSKSIGASEMAAAAGLSPYQTPLELYLRKRGEIPDIEDNDAMRMGRLLEPVVKSEFMRTSGITLRNPNPPMYIHPEYRQITATPDGIVDDSTLFEAKTASWRMKGEWGSEGSDDIPTAYVVQTQAQMAVLGADLVHLAVLFDGFTLKTFKVLRDDDLITLLLSAALELWERIQNGDPPEPNFEHASTPDLIRAKYKTDNGRRIMLSNAAVEARLEYERLGDIKTEAEKKQKLIRAVYEDEIGENFAGVLPDGRMIRRAWIPPGHRSFDVDGRWDYRAVKFDGKSLIPLCDVDRESRWQLAGQMLMASGAVLTGRSDESESMYWKLPDGRPVRISAHPANAATTEWMRSAEAAEIRIDEIEDVRAAVAKLQTTKLLEST